MWKRQGFEIRKHHLWWIIFKVLPFVLSDEFVGACDMIKNKRNWGALYEPRMNVYLELKEAVQGGIKTTQRILNELLHAEAVSWLEEEPGRFCKVTIGFLSWKKKWYIEIKKMQLQNSETWDKKKWDKLKMKALFFSQKNYRELKLGPCISYSLGPTQTLTSLMQT